MSQVSMSAPTRFPPEPATPEKAAWIASEREKWHALNAHMTPQFEGQRAYNEHGFAKRGRRPRIYIFPSGS